MLMYMVLNAKINDDTHISRDIEGVVFEELHDAEYASGLLSEATIASSLAKNFRAEFVIEGNKPFEIMEIETH